MRSRLAVFAALCGAGLALPSSAPAAAPSGAAGSDPKAAAVADQVLGALGGQEAFNNTRYLRFDFAVEKGGKTVASRAHTWDKWTGRYRLEGKEKDGTSWVTLMNIGTHEGTAYKKGQKLDGAEGKKALDDAFATWTNDTYWLLMPYKMKDAGVHLAYDGRKAQGKDHYDVVLLTFDKVGLTPQDKYWVWVNASTHLVDRWDFVLKGEKKPPTTFMWTGWARHGKIMLASEHEEPKSGTRINFPVLDAPESVPDATFTSADATKK